MTDGGLPDPEEPDEATRRDRESRLRPTGATPLTVAASVGIVGGWLLHPLGRALWGTPPFVTWLQVLGLVALAAALGVTAWVTWRALHVRHERMAAHLAVNRLALARAAAVVGALVAGGYVGYAISWLGVGPQLAGERLWRSLAAAVAALLVMCAALLLERACRVRPDEPGT